MEKGNAAKGNGEESKSNWLNVLAEVVLTQRRPFSELDLGELVQGLATRLGVKADRVKALVAGCDAIGKYAMSELDDEGDSLTEEDAALVASRCAFRPLLEARLQERVAHIDGADEPVLRCGAPQCSEPMHSKGLRKRGWMSSFGPIQLFRRWSVCDHAGHGPGRSRAEERLLLPDGPFTAKLSESLAALATTVPHGMACQLAERLLGVEVSEHAVQDEVEERAATLVAADELQAQELNPFEESGLEREAPRPLAEVPQPPVVAYVEVDGVLPMIREETPERSQPVPGARGGKGRRYQLEGKEVKNAVLYTGEAAARESDSRGCLLQKCYVSSLSHWLPFALLLWVQMLKHRFEQARLIVFHSDGAHWIRDLAGWLPCSSRVLLILDLYHAIHRLYEVANAVLGDGPAGREWRQRQKDDIEAGRVQHVIDRLRFFKPTNAESAKKAVELITYYENNADRMDYPSYRARGLRVSSASVESANYHVTGARTKAQGMRWSEKGAAEMARLRADLFNGIWEERTRQALAA